MRHTILFLMLMAVLQAPACTNLIVSRGASADGSTFITYAADSHTRYGQLRYCPAADHQPGETLRLYNYGNLKFQLEIAQPAHTYQVVGFINEHQLAIGETTWGGRKELEHGSGIGIDYGNLIYVTLQRARNCREAIRVMHELVSAYGYSDGGESFSLADPDEVWIFEIVGKDDGKGAVWVARRVPDGYISGHANQARVTTFPLEQKRSRRSLSSKNIKHIADPEVECVYSDDVVSFARRKGWYSGADADFSFADTYNPLTFSGLRACEARVYSLFRRCADDMQRYEAYAMGDPSAERLPLWVKPNRKLGVQDVMALMRDHFEGTPMDMTQDVGAGPFHCPYRWRPMDFEVDGKKYVHERAISTQQTGFSFVAQCRRWLPSKLGGVLWFGVDDTYSTVYCPVYCGVTQVPVCFEEGNGSMSQYSETAAFWLFNRVSNFCYLRYDSMIQDVVKAQRELEEGFVADERRYAEQWAREENDRRLVGALNRFSNDRAERMMRRWTELDRFLLMKYIDGNIKHHDADGNIKTTPEGVVRFPQQPPYPEWFYRQIVDERGEVLQVR
ncbi:MAG: C69 family peptidase [bacterium P3]|nr:MAG: C69 family peptidase [bacterium P3]KWW40070.1 MAG: C69 family peptidase [bacterium F083]